jgi:hypothetical protein
MGAEGSHTIGPISGGQCHNVGKDRVQEADIE